MTNPDGRTKRTFHQIACSNENLSNFSEAVEEWDLGAIITIIYIRFDIFKVKAEKPFPSQK